MSYNPDEHKYDRIINLPHHQSKKRKHMSMYERAAQFGAFRALTGYEDEIAETARHTDSRTELDEYEKADLDQKLKYINDHIDNRHEVTVTYFVPDEKKSGGSYVTVTGIIVKIKEYEKLLVLEDNTKIPINDISFLEYSNFEL